MIKMTDSMREWLSKALEDGVPCLLGTATRDGLPQISPKGSFAVFNDDTLSFWERSFRSSFHRLEENPKVVVYYRNPARTKEIPYRAATLRFYGEARVVRSGPDRDRAWDLAGTIERERDPERVGVGVLIRVDRIEDIGGKPIMERDT